MVYLLPWAWSVHFLINSYLADENEYKTKRKIYAVIYTDNYYQYILTYLSDKENKLFTFLSNLQNNLFRLYLPKLLNA